MHATVAGVVIRGAGHAPAVGSVDPGSVFAYLLVMTTSVCPTCGVRLTLP